MLTSGRWADSLLSKQKMRFSRDLRLSGSAESLDFTAWKRAGDICPSLRHKPAHCAGSMPSFKVHYTPVSAIEGSENNNPCEVIRHSFSTNQTIKSVKRASEGLVKPIVGSTLYIAYIFIGELAGCQDFF